MTHTCTHHYGTYMYTCTMAMVHTCIYHYGNTYMHAIWLTQVYIHKRPVNSRLLKEYNRDMIVHSSSPFPFSMLSDV